MSVNVGSRPTATTTQPSPDDVTTTDDAARTSTTDDKKLSGQPFSTDHLDLSTTLAVDTSTLDEPTLPTSETLLPEAQKHEQSDAVAGAMGLLDDAVKATLSFEAIGDILQRANTLKENPDQSFLAAALGPDFGAQIAAYFKEANPNGVGIDKAAFAAEFGDFTAEFVDKHASDSLTFMQTAIFSKDAGPFLGLTDAQFKQGSGLFEGAFAQVVQNLQTGKGIDLSATSAFGVSTQLPAGATTSTTTYKDGKLTADPNAKPATASEVIQNLGVIAEAGYEYLLGMFSKLQSEDNKKHLEQLKTMLDTLKAQKEGLLKQIEQKTNEIAGKELGGAISAKEAEKAGKCAQTWGMIKAIAIIIIAVVVAVIAVVLTPFTGGMSLALIALVCVLISTAITVAQQIPELLQAVAALLDSLGMSGAAKMCREASEKLQKMLADPTVMKTLMVIQILCAVCSLGCGMASALTAGAGAAEGAEAAANTGITASTESAMRTASLCVQVAGGVAMIAISVGMASAQKDLIAAMNAIEQLKGQLALVEVEIKEVMNEIALVEKREKDWQDSAQRAEETNNAITDNLQAAADKGKQSWDAVLSVGQ